MWASALAGRTECQRIDVEVAALSARIPNPDHRQDSKTYCHPTRFGSNLRADADCQQDGRNMRFSDCGFLNRKCSVQQSDCVSVRFYDIWTNCL